MTVEEYIKQNKINPVLKYMNQPFQVWETSAVYLLVWDGEIIKVINKY